MARIVASGATTVVPSAAGMLAQLVGSLALLAIMVPQIAWMLIPAGIVFAGFTLGFRRVPKRLHKRIRETDGCARSHLIECLNSLLVVKSFQGEDFAERGAAALLEDHRAACMRRNRFSNLCNVGFGLAMRAAYLVAAAYCAYGILEGSVSYESTLPLGLLWRRRELPLGDYSPIRKNLKRRMRILSARRRISTRSFANRSECWWFSSTIWIACLARKSGWSSESLPYCLFPKIIYVLSFDRGVVSRALSEVQGFDGDLYLEKIVQLPVDLPPVSRKEVREKVNALFESLNQDGSFRYSNNDSLRLELIGLNLVVSSLNTTRRLIRFENILALKRLHVGKGIEPIDLLGMVSIQLFFPKVFEWVKRNALYLCDERRSDLPPPESVAV